MYYINFSTSYWTRDTLDNGEEYEDYSHYECTYHFNTFDDAYMWFKHYNNAVTMCDDPSLEGGVSWYLSGIALDLSQNEEYTGDDPYIPIRDMHEGTKYPCDYDHTSWNKLVASKYEFCKQ